MNDQRSIVFFQWKWFSQASLFPSLITLTPTVFPTGVLVTTHERCSNALPFFLPSSIICKVYEDAVEGCADEEDHSGFRMHSEWYFNPSKSCTELEQDQDHVDKPKDSNDRNFDDLHIRFPHGGDYFTIILCVAGPLLPCILQLASATISASSVTLILISLVKTPPSGRLSFV
jgi:hypothetical protein